MSIFDDILRGIGLKTPEQGQPFNPSLPEIPQLSQDFMQGFNFKPTGSQEQSPVTPEDSIASLFNPQQDAPAQQEAPPPMDMGMQPPEEQMGQDIDVAAWAPGKRSTLGKISDIVLAAYGQKPMYEPRYQEAQMNRAMEGFTHDPLSVIRRMATLNGPKAFEMFQEYQKQQADIGAKQAVGQKAKFSVEDRAFELASAIMHGANEETAPQMYQTALKVLRTRGVDPADYGLSDQYDPKAGAALRSGGIKPDDQIDNERQYEQLNIQDFNAQTGRMNANENARNNQAREGIARDQESRLRSNSKSETKNVFSEDGRFVGTVDPTGRRAALRGIDGQWYAFRLRTPGDISSRQRSPGEDEALRKSMTVEQE